MCGALVNSVFFFNTKGGSLGPHDMWLSCTSHAFSTSFSTLQMFSLSISLQASFLPNGFNIESRFRASKNGLHFFEGAARGLFDGELASVVLLGQVARKEGNIGMYGLTSRSTHHE